ncbi:DUF4241 domain-containing protein [Actinomadura sp. WMMB 499]|uniref:DUF4241 domain-containing protein n=1 Tax=Actinomadura sp. WMMB 499 TaxID=1219491 RepID=UPI00159DB6E6|nr:DUF4241 domain-containing protein [Actinomadura sp. WMMB 499]
MEEFDLSLMFDSHCKFWWDNETCSLIDVQPVGMVRLPSGRIVVQGPGWRSGPEVEHLDVTVPPGDYPVTLSISEWNPAPVPDISSPMRRVNAARIGVIDEPVVSWELAFHAGRAGGEANDEVFDGFSVDSGTGCFFDASARHVVERIQHDGSALEEAMLRVLDVGGIEVSSCDRRFNVVVFKCGMGDGGYRTWIGRTGRGEVACFVADLELLRHSVGFERV